MISEFSGVNHAYRVVLDYILKYGKDVEPRGKKTKEVPGFVFRINDSRRNVLISPNRAMSLRYMVAEWLWIMYGRNDVLTILPFNKNLESFSDDGQSFSGAYGPKVAEQWSFVRTTLEKDKDSRQAVMTLWTPRPRDSRDIPCTIALQFLIRDGRLNLITTMRSNDAWLGLPYDLYTFTQLQMVMASQLGVETGWYQHQTGSMHLYEPHYEVAQKVIEEAKWNVYDKDAVDTMTWLGRAYLLERSPSVAIPNYMESMFIAMATHYSDKSKDYPFTDDPNKLASGLSNVEEVQSWIAILMNMPINRYKLIKELQEEMK